MAREFPDIPHNTRKVYRRFEMWRSAHTGRVPITEQLVGCGGTTGARAWGFPSGGWREGGEKA